MLKNSGFAILAVAVLCTFSTAQDKGKRPSPPEQAQCKFSDGKTITVDYSSPRAKGRKIFGDLVPYGEVWRTGANEATTFVTSAGVSADGRDVPAGNYTIFTLPEQGKWTLIVNKHTGEWGIPYKYELKNWCGFRCRFQKLPRRSRISLFDSTRAEMPAR